MSFEELNFSLEELSFRKRMRKLEHRLVYIMHTEKKTEKWWRKTVSEKDAYVYINSIVGPITYRNELIVKYKETDGRMWSSIGWRKWLQMEA